MLLTVSVVAATLSHTSVSLSHSRPCSKQLRTRDCANCTIFLYSKTDPVVEQSHGMLFRPFNGACPRLGAHMAAARLEPQHSHWRRVFDFSKDDAALPQPHWQAQRESRASAGGRRACWLRFSHVFLLPVLNLSVYPLSLSSPHSLPTRVRAALPVPAPFTIINLKGCDGEAPENPVPHHSAPRDEGTFIPGAGLAAATAGLAPSKMLSFDIRTGQAAAEAALAAAVAEAEAQEVDEDEASDASGAAAAAPPVAAAAVGSSSAAPIAPVALGAAPAVLAGGAPPAAEAAGLDLRAAPVDAQLPLLVPSEPAGLAVAGTTDAAAVEPLHPDASAAAAPKAAVPPAPAGSRLAAVPDAADPPALPAVAAASGWPPAPVPPAAAAPANAHGLTAEDLDAITFDG